MSYVYKSSKPREFRESELRWMDELLKQIEPFQQYVSLTQDIYQRLLKLPGERKKKSNETLKSALFLVACALIIYILVFVFSVGLLGGVIVFFAFIMGCVSFLNLIGDLFTRKCKYEKELNQYMNAHPNESQSAKALLNGKTDEKLQNAKEQMQLIGNKLNPLIEALKDAGYSFIVHDVVEEKRFSAGKIAQDMLSGKSLMEAYSICNDEFADECIRELARQQQEEENRRARRERQEQKEALEGIRDSINQSNRDAQRRFEYEKWRDLKQDIDRWNRR